MNPSIMNALGCSWMFDALDDPFSPLYPHHPTYSLPTSPAWSYKPNGSTSTSTGSPGLKLPSAVTRWCLSAVHFGYTVLYTSHLTRPRGASPSCLARDVWVHHGGCRESATTSIWWHNIYSPLLSHSRSCNIKQYQSVSVPVSISVCSSIHQCPVQYRFSISLTRLTSCIPPLPLYTCIILSTCITLNTCIRGS